MRKPRWKRPPRNLSGMPDLAEGLTALLWFACSVSFGLSKLILLMAATLLIAVTSL